jgi:hypothetical protein
MDGLVWLGLALAVLGIEEIPMPEKKTVERARRDKSQGKAPSTQAGEFVREEVHHIREGKHGARSPKQAIAIGLSKARQAGVDLPPPKPGTTSEKTRRSASRAYERGQDSKGTRAPSSRRSRATSAALRREGKGSASRQALSRQAKQAATKRSPSNRSAAARKAAETKGPRGRAAAASKAARSRRAGQ